MRVPEGSEVTQECHVAAGSSSGANLARLPPSSSSEAAPSGIAIVAPMSLEVGIAIVALASSVAGISHELEAVLVADLVSDTPPRVSPAKYRSASGPTHDISWRPRPPTQVSPSWRPRPVT